MENLIYYIIGFLILFIVFFTYIDNVKKKARKEGWDHAMNDIAGSINSFSYWMSYDTTVFNTLKIIQSHIKNYGRIDTWYLRDNIKKLGNTKITDLTEEEQREYI